VSSTLSLFLLSLLFRSKHEHEAENIEYHLGLINKASLERDGRTAKVMNLCHPNDCPGGGLWWNLVQESERLLT
jgi:hypothetical protein